MQKQFLVQINGDKNFLFNVTFTEKLVHTKVSQ